MNMGLINSERENFMEKIYSEFKNFLESEDKENAVRFILEKVNKNEFDIISLYDYIRKTTFIHNNTQIWR